MATTDFTNATLKLLIEDRDGIVTVASLQQADVPPPIHAATKILTNAQIRALPGTPVVIIPPTELLNYSGHPSKLFFVTKAYAILDTRGGGYTNVDNGSTISLAWGSDNSDTIGWAAMVPGSNFTAGTFQLLTGYPSTTQQVLAFNFVIGEHVVGDGDLYDNAIVISANNQGQGDFTGGHAANTLKVVVQYFEVAVP